MKMLIPFLAAVLSFVLLSFGSALAGAPPLQWQKTFGGSDYDAGFSVQQTTDGGYIITGNTRSYGAGNSDVYLIKTDPNGDMQWQKTYGGTDSDWGNSVQQTSDGGYIIAGYTRSYGAGDPNVYLIKTDPNGNMHWQKTFAKSAHDAEAQSVQQTTDGGYIIAGRTVWYYGDRPWERSSDVYLIKTDPNGNSEWQRTFGGTHEDWGYSVQQTSDGGYIIAGGTSSFGAVLRDVYLIKTDSAADLQWQRTFGGRGDDCGRSVQQTSDEGYIIAGYTSSFDHGNYDVCLIKTDSVGSKEWQKTFGGMGADHGYAVQQTCDSGYIIASMTNSFGTGRWDVYLIKTDPSGNSQWEKTFGGIDADRGGYSVQQTSDGGYIITGSTGSYGAAEYDVYLIKLCSDGTLSVDFNCNGIVYFEDLAILAAEWLQPPDILSADIAPELGDGIVNFFDFRILANDWLQTTIP